MNGEAVLVVGADPGMQGHLASLLRGWGYTAIPARSLEEAFAALTPTHFLFSLVDGELTQAGGLEILHQLRARGGDPGPIIMLADPNTLTRSQETPSADIDAILRKPVESAALETTIREVLSRPRRPWKEAPAHDLTVRLQREITLWRSPKMQRVWEIIQHAARVDVPVLICGETGTGKSLVARAIHHLSPRQGRPFVTVNCSTVPGELLESLFGHERPDVTGADQLRVGEFESATHGAVLLDYVDALPPALQAKLLHLLQDGGLSRVGGDPTGRVDVRVLAATNQDLERAVGAGRFREDLYHRLNAIQIVVPPLRERPEEIPLLVNYFIERYSLEFHREGFTLPPTVMARLLQYRYPGNIRELENFVRCMILLNDPGLSSRLGVRIEAGEAGRDIGETAEVLRRSLKDIGRAAARAAEREAIAKALEETGWNRVRAARLLKISYRALLYKMKEAGLGHGPRPVARPPELRAG